jgi:hypothetical protein
MAVLEPRYSKEEFAQQGQTIYERDIRPHLGAGDDGKFVRSILRQGRMSSTGMITPRPNVCSAVIRTHRSGFSA